MDSFWHFGTLASIFPLEIVLQSIWWWNGLLLMTKTLYTSITIHMLSSSTNDCCDAGEATVGHLGWELPNTPSRYIDCRWLRAYFPLPGERVMPWGLRVVVNSVQNVERTPHTFRPRGWRFVCSSGDVGGMWWNMYAITSLTCTPSCSHQHISRVGMFAPWMLGLDNFFQPVSSSSGTIAGGDFYP